MSAEGETYDEAKASLVKDLEICPFYNKWIWEHIEL